MFCNQGVFGNFNWELFGCVLFCDYFIYLVVSGGVKTTGKVAVFTVIAPYVMLIILLIRTLFLDGSSIGLSYLLNFESAKIYSPTTWYRVLDQHFFQHGIGFGYVFCFSTMRNYYEKVWRSAVV